MSAMSVVAIFFNEVTAETVLNDNRAGGHFITLANGVVANGVG